MQPDIVQARYDALAEVAARFERCSSASGDLNEQLKRGYGPLADGGWRGKGATSFVAEMEGELFPAMQRLIGALESARAVTLDIRAIMQRADEEASQPFRGGAATGAAPPAAAAGQESKSWWGRWGEWVHTALDGIGFIPGAGEIADGLNGLIYLAEGRYVEATISAAAMIPIIGDAGKVGKLGLRAGKEVLEETAEVGAKRLVREEATQVAETEARRVIREEAEHAAAAGERRVLKFGELEPSTRYVRNGHEYITDEVGRVSEVRGALDLKPGVRDPYTQRMIGHEGIPGDQGGHLIGTRFDGTPEGINVVPQSGNLNQGAWKRMENEWARALENKSNVRVDIKVRYGQGGSMRPSRFDVTYWIDGLPTTRVIRNRPGG